MYLDSDVPPISLTEWWLGGALGAGYHLLRVRPPLRLPHPGRAGRVRWPSWSAGACPTTGPAHPGTARAYCKAPYRLQPTTLDEAIVLKLGPRAGGPGAACP